MRVGRTIPPAAAPITIKNIIRGITASLNSENEIERFQQSICRYFHCKYCYLISSGKAAISILLSTLSMIYPNRKKVIIPAFNCYSVPSSIVNVGFKVCTCDINSQTLQMDEKSLFNIIKKPDEILAIIPAYLYGIPASISWIIQYAKENEIPVIEDAAQAMGSNLEGKLLGCQAETGVFSLSRGKAFSTGGGGVIITHNEEIGSIVKEKIDSLPELNIVQKIKLVMEVVALSVLVYPQLYWLPKCLPFLKLGETIYNPFFKKYKFSSFQAGIASNWESELQRFQKERAVRNQYYEEQLWGIKGIIQILNRNRNEDSHCIRYPIIIKKKEHLDKIIEKSDLQGLGINRSYPDSIDNLSLLANQGEKKCLMARELANSLITLPCHPLVRKIDMDKIIEIIKTIA